MTSKEKQKSTVLLHFQEKRPNFEMPIRTVFAEIECEDARKVIDKLVQWCDDEFDLEIVTDDLTDLFEERV